MASHDDRTVPRLAQAGSFQALRSAEARLDPGL